MPETMPAIERDAWVEALKTRYFLTPTEIAICVHLAHGNTRPDLRRLLDLNENCLKWHLKQLYAKIIGDSPLERDKLHRLTQFLHLLQDGKTTLEDSDTRRITR